MTKRRLEAFSDGMFTIAITPAGHRPSPPEVDAGERLARSRRSWGPYIGTGCRCDDHAPCLAHFDTLDWRGRNQALARAGVQPPTGR
jgi:hypothetical protein